MAFNPRSYWEKRLGKNYSLLGVGSIDLGSSYNQWLYKVRKKNFSRIYQRIFKDRHPGKVLDVGSGTGFYVDLWQRSGAKTVTASDLTRVAVRNLQDRFPRAKVLRLDIGGTLPRALRPGSFDEISAFDVFFHIVDPDRFRKAFQNVGRLLKPGGQFFYSDNLASSESAAQHQTTRSESKILRAAQRAGLRATTFQPVFFLMNNPVRRPGKLLWRVHGLIQRLVRLPGMGGLVGALLFPLEILLTGLCRRGTGTEIVVFEKGMVPTRRW